MRRRHFKPERAKAEKAAGGTGINRAIGELRLHRDGYGFVVVAREGWEDVFVPARFISDALHTDLVEVRAVVGRAGKLEGRITKIVERRVTNLMGRLERHGKIYQVVADDRRVRHRIIVPDDALGGAKHGDNVIVKIQRYPDGDRPMLGRVMETLGRRGEVETEVSAVVSRHQFEVAFGEDALAEANAAKELAAGSFQSLEGREDLRSLPFVTIDGETAKDFDDAVAVERAGDGRLRLWVSIADVSYYVRPRSALDKVAYERGTSVYFPGDCIPMLPEVLSTDLCSLRPDEDRLTVTAEMEIDASGNVARRRFYRSVIRSRERMTYAAIKKILVEKDEATRERYKGLVQNFELMEDCFDRLRRRRLERGSIDFDLPEPEIVMDMNAEVSDIVRAERHVGHMMIEEFMIAANEVVADFLTRRNAGCIYRVHEPPSADKLREFGVLIHNLGYKFRLSKGVTSGSLARIVEAVHGKPEERLVNHMLLRSMAQAVYSDENLGHYGLASKCYCHFTSPIRRYPDLIVHRLLVRALGGARSDALKYGGARLKEISEHCSRRERIAMEAEREMAKLYAALFMQDRVGDGYDGIISHVGKFGFYVELVDFFVEGLVHMDSLDDDRYIYKEEGQMIIGKHQKKAYKIGDRVRVEVEEVNVQSREILFSLL